MGLCPFASGASGAAVEASERARGGEREASSSSGLETLTNELVNSLRPTPMSEMRRRAVFEHIKDLAQGCFGTAHTLVSAYGSVPLRAYLPDGDIDVCLLGDHRVIDKATWTNKFRKHIEKVEAESEPHEFAVSEVSVINAEVRLMKCIVDGMMVDVSANQFGGLASLGFLEETNTFIGRDDLFVRSIILVKAWGFYEGRILGAHHALIATYALETLVLYIINKYHAELTCPLSVLHKLLKVFAEFDWEGHALSIHGPVAIEEVSGAPAGCLEGGLLTEEFMQSMLAQYGHSHVSESSTSAPFVVKYMNIIDPLVPNNNLGRSVSCGNYRRVRAAFRLGAQRLDKLMAYSEMSDDFGVLRAFADIFGNILRHRRLVYPLPHAPPTPGAAPHADEVSLTPLGMPTSAIALRSRSCLVAGTTPATAPATHPHTRSVVDELQPRQLNLAAAVEELEVSAVKQWLALGEPASPDRITLGRSDSHGSLSDQQRGIHWGRWDVLIGEQGELTDSGELDRRDSLDIERENMDSIDDDSAKMSASPPRSDSSNDAGDQNDSGDGSSERRTSPPIPEDALAPGINDIFTGCLNTIREHFAFGVYHHARALERQRAARQSAEDRRRANNQRRNNGKPAYSRSRNVSRSNKAAKNVQQQGFQPPPPPGAPPPGTVKRDYSSDSNSTAVFEDIGAHFPLVQVAADSHTQPPQRPRSPRPSPTFPQAWSGVAKLPPTFMEEKSAAATSATALSKEVEKLAVAAPETLSPPVGHRASTPTPPPTAPSTASSSPARPSWGPKGSAPIELLKATAAKPVSNERPASEPRTTAEQAPAPPAEDNTAPIEETAAKSTRRERPRRNRQRIPDAECDVSFPSLGGNAADASPAESTSSSTTTKTWAKVL